VKFRVERDVLADALAWAGRSLPARPTVPVLAGMLLEVADRLTVSSFDYEVSAQVSIDVEVGEPGRVLVPGRLLSEIARSLPAAPVDVNADAARLAVTCGGSRFTLQTLPVEDYPSLPRMPQVAGTVGSAPFAEAVGQVVLAASRDETLPMLTGVRVEIDGDRLTLVCTDRFRIAVRELEWAPRQPDIAATALIPARTLAGLARALPPAASVSVALAVGSGVGQGMVGFECDGRRTTTRLLDGEFVLWRSRFPTDFGHRATVPTAPFIEAVKRVGLVADRSTPVLLSFSRGQVVLESASGEEAHAVESLAAEFDDDGDIPIAFNPQFLLDGLTAIGSPAARLQFSTPTKPALLTAAEATDAEPTDGGRPDRTTEPGAPAFRYLTMPIRI
jgi:DNA polymerase-3 subunit beta